MWLVKEFAAEVAFVFNNWNLIPQMTFETTKRSKNLNDIISFLI